MTATETACYVMNPAEDTLIYGDELAEGMWVLPASPTARSNSGSSEDSVLRGERFRRVTRLRRQAAGGGLPELAVFIGEWVDGYLEFHTYGLVNGWIVKKDSMPGAEKPNGGAA